MNRAIKILLSCVIINTVLFFLLTYEKAPNNLVEFVQENPIDYRYTNCDWLDISPFLSSAHQGIEKIMIVRELNDILTKSGTCKDDLDDFLSNSTWAQFRSRFSKLLYRTNKEVEGLEESRSFFKHVMNFMAEGYHCLAGNYFVMACESLESGLDDYNTRPGEMRVTEWLNGMMVWLIIGMIVIAVLYFLKRL